MNAGFLPSTVGSTAVSIFGKKLIFSPNVKKKHTEILNVLRPPCLKRIVFFLPDESRDVELGGDFCKKDLQTKS